MNIEHEIIIGRSGTGMSISTFLESLQNHPAGYRNHGEEHQKRFRFQILDVGESCEEIVAELSGKEKLS